MHPTLKTLKSLPDDIEGDLLMGAATRLFDLDPSPNPNRDGADDRGHLSVVRHKEHDEHSTG